VLRHGFVLTRHWRDTPSGVEVEFWLATDEGPQHVRLPVQTSVAFVPQAQRAQVEALVQDERNIELRELALRDFHSRPVLGLYSQQHGQLIDIAQRLRRAGVEVFEADIRPPERFLMERFITAPVSFSGQPQTDGPLLDTRMKPHPDYRPRLKLVSLDIETSAQGDLYSIALEGCGQRQVYMLGKATDADTPVDFDLEFCATRGDLLLRLNHWMALHDPDAIIGWNVVQFDMRILNCGVI